jgi:hypothetical protein
MQSFTWGNMHEAKNSRRTCSGFTMRRSGLRVFGNAEGVLAGKAKGLKLLREIVSELD